VRGVKWQELKIGLIGPLPPPAGGMAGQTQQLEELLRGEGAHVILVQTNAPYRPAWIGSVRGIRAVFRLIPYLRALWTCAGRVHVFHIMSNSGWSWDLLAAPAVWIGKLRDVRVIVNYRGGEAAAFLAKARWRVLPTLRLADVLAVPSTFLREVFRRFGADARILPNIVDLRRFRPSNNVVHIGSGGRLLVARNLEPIYDVATAIRAFAVVRQQRPDAAMLIAGTGPERRALELLARELGVSSGVTFTGRLDREQMAELYRNVDVAINPSLVDNMPNSLLEALASGVPIVSTDVGGVPHMVCDGVTALLVPPREPEALADGVLRLLEDPELRAQLRSAGLRDVEDYAWPRIRERLFALYVPVQAPEAGQIEAA